MYYCPNCNNEMIELDNFYQIDLLDGKPPLVVPYYYCPNCEISRVENNWNIPKKYKRPTEKQIKCVKFICRKLGMTYEPLIRSKTWKFINTYLEKALERKIYDRYY